VTAPLSATVPASSRPSIVAPFPTDTEVWAKMVPLNVEFAPNVAELPTCQNTLHACAPLTSNTVLFALVPSVDPAWKMNTASGLPSASRVMVPDSARDVASL
jgi:hypothetical protein